LSEKLVHCGRSQVCLTASLPNVFARQREVVMRTVKIESCSTSVMIPTVLLAAIVALIVRLLSFKRDEKKVESIELV